MNRLAVLVLIAACDRRAPKEQPAPAPSGSALVVPDVTTIDWRSQTYELSSLGTVTAKDGRADFRIIEDATGETHADQSGSAKDKGTEGSLVLAPAHFVDLDGDQHDEAIIPFVMRAMHPGEAEHVFGAFVYTLREGIPLRLDVVTASAPIDVDGATLSTTDPQSRWHWANGHFIVESN